MAATNKFYLDKVGLETLIGKIKNHIAIEAATKVQKIQYNDTSKQLQWTKNGTDWTNIDVTSWVRDIYLNSIKLSANGVITLTLNGVTSNNTKSIDLKDWFNPDNYVITKVASDTYLKSATAASTYLSKTTATNTYIIAKDGIQTITTAEIDTAWGQS